MDDLEFAATFVEGMAPSTRSPLIGARLAGRYEIIERIGAGGMGEVFRAHDRELDEPVALKLLRPDIAEDPDMLERFRNEVKLARRVTHRSVARMFELGTADGQRFLTMELVLGESLGSVLAREGRLDVSRALRIAIGIAEALEAAHAASVLHRDIKPDNVLVEPGGRVAVTDFGIARQLVSGEADLSGTPAYMAPEQASGGGASPSSDLYAFGITLFEVLTGARPFPPESALATLARRIREAPPDPRVHRPELAASLAGLVLRAIATRPEDRFSSARDMKSALLAELARAASLPSVRPPPPDGSRAARGARAHRLPTLALFPFAGREGETYLTEALFDQVAMRMADQPGARVVTRAFVEDDSSGALAELAASLDADLFLARSDDGAPARDAASEPKSTPAPEKALVRASVIDVRSGETRWMMTLPVSARRLRGVADTVARACALAMDLDPRAEDATEDDPVARDLELRARFHFQSPLVADLERAIALFERAIERAPGQPSLLAGLAMARTRRAFFAGTARGELDRARALAESAVGAAPHLADAHLALGHLALHSGEPVPAAAHFRQALALAPHLAEAHEWVGRMLLEIAYLDDATKRLATALRIDPRLRTVRWEMARAHALEADWDGAERLLVLAQGGDKRVGRWAGHIRFAAWRSDRADRLAALEPQYRAAAPEEVFDKGFCDALIDAHRYGYVGAARGVLLERASDDAYESYRRRSFYCQVVAEIASADGHVGDGFAMVERAFALGLFDLHWIDRCPLLEPMRADARFGPLRARIYQRAETVADALFKASGN